jgi:hypothetical protein
MIGLGIFPGSEEKQKKGNALYDVNESFQNTGYSFFQFTKKQKQF